MKCLDQKQLRGEGVCFISQFQAVCYHFGGVTAAGVARVFLPCPQSEQRQENSSYKRVLEISHHIMSPAERMRAHIPSTQSLFYSYTVQCPKPGIVLPRVSWVFPHPLRKSRQSLADIPTSQVIWIVLHQDSLWK